MRLFQNSGVYPEYLRRFDRRNAGCRTFDSRLQAFIADRYAATHFLQPVLDGSATAFFTNGDDGQLQRLWAREQGLPASASPADILAAQIEAHRTEVFYNLDPVRFGNAFLKRLPGCVRVSIAWRAAPSGAAEFSGYQRIVCNFPSILADYARQGVRGAYFHPAFDPHMTPYGNNEQRPIDVIFIGTYSQHHRRRAAVLEAVADLAGQVNVVYCLAVSRLARLADGPLGLLPIPALRRNRRPRSVRQITRSPVYGRDMYQLLSQAKIVLNGAIEMAGRDRGNMRCFESLGCGALLISDSGVYPAGMVPGDNLVCYTSPADVRATILGALKDWEAHRSMARRGFAMMQERYSKDRQFACFQQIVAEC